MMTVAATPARSELLQPGAAGSDEDKSGTALAWVLLPSIVITHRGGQAPGQGRRTEDTMPHDKIRAAARKRTGETGEPYAAARRAAVTEHQRESLSPGTGYALCMSGEIRDLRCPKLSGQGSNRILIWKGTGSSAKGQNLYS